MDQIMYVPRIPFNPLKYLPTIILLLIAYATFNSGANLVNQLAFLVASRIVVYCYQNTPLLLNSVMLEGLVVMLAFMFVPMNFVWNATFVTGLMLFLAFQYIPPHYMACLAVLIIVGMYLLVMAYLAVLHLTQLGNAAVITMLYLTAGLVLYARPPLRMADE
jgi:hypothetical protein